MDLVSDSGQMIKMSNFSFGKLAFIHDGVQRKKIKIK